MRAFLYQIAVTLFHLGGFGVLILGILDSSFLFMPLGNDLLVIAMTARNRSLMLYYAAMATAGSVLGSLLVDIVFRKGGEELLARHISPGRFESMRTKVEKGAGWAVGAASLMPPPFPFTPFVAVSAALDYPRKKLLSVVAVTRFLRFSVEGTLVLFFGRRILGIAESSAVQWGIAVLILISIAGSAIQIVRLVKRPWRKREA